MNNPTARIALIHATALAVEPIGEAFGRHWPQAQHMNLLDDGLSIGVAHRGHDRAAGRWPPAAPWTTPPASFVVYREGACRHAPPIVERDMRAQYARYGQLIKHAGITAD